MKFRDIIEDEGGEASPAVSTITTDDIAQFGDRIGAKKKKKPPIAKKPLVNWRKNHVEVESLVAERDYSEFDDLKSAYPAKDSYSIFTETDPATKVKRYIIEKNNKIVFGPTTDEKAARSKLNDLRTKK